MTMSFFVDRKNSDGKVDVVIAGGDNLVWAFDPRTGR